MPNDILFYHIQEYKNKLRLMPYFYTIYKSNQNNKLWPKYHQWFKEIKLLKVLNRREKYVINPYIPNSIYFSNIQK